MKTTDGQGAAGIPGCRRRGTNSTRRARAPRAHSGAGHRHRGPDITRSGVTHLLLVHLLVLVHLQLTPLLALAPRSRRGAFVRVRGLRVHAACGRAHRERGTDTCTRTCTCTLTGPRAREVSGTRARTEAGARARGV